MKRNVLVLLFLGAVLFETCAQNANIAQKIIGTWIDKEGNTWVFSSNGKLILSEDLNIGGKGPYETTYNILTFGNSNAKLEFTGWGFIDHWRGPVSWEKALLTYDISISDDE